jgi:hypothetical protein
LLDDAHRLIVACQARLLGGIKLNHDNGVASKSLTNGRRETLIPAMARPLRIDVPGAWYHVMNRGHRGGALFMNDADRRRIHLNPVRVGGLSLSSDDQRRARVFWSRHPKYNFHANDIDFQIEADFMRGGLEMHLEMRLKNGIASAPRQGARDARSPGRKAVGNTERTTSTTKSL